MGRGTEKLGPYSCLRLFILLLPIEAVADFGLPSAGVPECTDRSFAKIYSRRSSTRPMPSWSRRPTRRRGSRRCSPRCLRVDRRCGRGRGSGEQRNRPLRRYRADLEGGCRSFRLMLGGFLREKAPWLHPKAILTVKDKNGDSVDTELDVSEYKGMGRSADEC